METLLARTREVDRDVAAENEPESAVTIRRSEQVLLLPANARAHVCRDPHVVERAAAREGKVVCEQVGAEQERTVENSEAIEQERDAVELGAVGAARRPDRDPSRAGDEPGEDLALQEVELLRIAEETGDGDCERAPEARAGRSVALDKTCELFDRAQAFARERTADALADMRLVVGAEVELGRQRELGELRRRHAAPAARSSSTASSKVWRLNGFATKRVTPASVAASRSAAWARAVSRITGVSARFGSLRASRTTSSPLRPGIIMSITIRSGRRRRATASASSPVDASSTFTVRSASEARTSSRRTSSSSQMRIVAAIADCGQLIGVSHNGLKTRPAIRGQLARPRSSTTSTAASGSRRRWRGRTGSRRTTA